MTAFNFFGQWAGDYTAAGITTIRMDVNNLGSTDLNLRLLFGAVGGGGATTDLALTSSAILVEGGSGWQTISFGVEASDLVSGGLGTIADALAGAAFLRIFDNAAPAFPGPEVVANLGVDNISAVPVPPAIVYLASGIVGLFCRRRVAA